MSRITSIKLPGGPHDVRARHRVDRHWKRVLRRVRPSPPPVYFSTVSRTCRLFGGSPTSQAKPHEKMTDDEGEQEQSFGTLNREFAERCTAHGFNRIASTRRLRRLLWAVIVVVAVGGFLYHISFLTSNYFSYPIMTATEEVHAEELHFPAITVCNLNLLRKSSFDDYLKDIAVKAGYPTTGFATTPWPDWSSPEGGSREDSGHVLAHVRKVTPTTGGNRGG
ncbi:hypothetical protein HPB51_002380 [Rhipicephalus microplus]|uniref:Amiloride-sensitive sodium channel n=1 Tax=Rhipicephalus microplus TaxID=6941 RepID=A0A9J6DSL5_RHIMP|nr:hypothetical protein HPB51_002380 [Rhipicephalus microplus]